MTTGKVALGVIAGVAAGAILGILFAPDKGTVTRKKIMRKKDDITDDLKNKFDDFIESISEKYEAVQEEISEFAGKAEHKSDSSK